MYPCAYKKHKASTLIIMHFSAWKKNWERVRESISVGGFASPANLAHQEK